MTGIAEMAGVWRMWRQGSKPSDPGNITSRRNNAGISRSASETTDAPLTKLRTSNPLARRLWVMRRAMSASSSTTKMRERSAPETLAAGVRSKGFKGGDMFNEDHTASPRNLRHSSSEKLYEDNVARMFTAC